MTAIRPSKSRQVRSRLSHPVVDADGHSIEPTPVLLDYIERVGGHGMADRYSRARNVPWHQMSPEERRDTWTPMPAWWFVPGRNTLDRATASLPRLQYERMDDLGLDFAVLYPTLGISLPMVQEDEVRRVASRAFNIYQAEMYGEYADRLTPAAVIPMHTPEEAIDELDHAVGELGLKAIMIAGHVKRPIPKLHRERPDLDEVASRLDTFGIDSDHDYDPVWARCVELGVAVTSHAGLQGWGTRRSLSRYMFNQCGQFAEGCEVLCKSLFMGGVTRRFPGVNFAFLEGGIGWAASLYAGMASRWEKRNADAIAHLDPANMDRELMAKLIDEYGNGAIKDKRQQVWEQVTHQPPVPTELDDWAACGMSGPDDFRERFTGSFYFGCEADDPLNTWAFDTRINPYGARLKATFGSDIGHHDVPDMTEVVDEAYEMVERGLMTEDDFRDFVFVNPVMLHAGMNPDFFKGTRVEAEVQRLLGEALTGGSLGPDGRP